VAALLLPHDAEKASTIVRIKIYLIISMVLNSISKFNTTKLYANIQPDFMPKIGKPPDTFDLHEAGLEE